MEPGECLSKGEATRQDKEEMGGGVRDVAKGAGTSPSNWIYDDNMVYFGT